MENEQILVEKSQQGDGAAFALLYDHYVNKIYNFIYYRTMHKPTAEDLASVTFTKAYVNIHSFRSSSGTFGAWLYRIARNTVIDYYRTHKKAGNIDDAWDLSTDDDLERDFDVRDKLDKVKSYLATLPKDQREIVIMRVWDNMSYKEIADVLGKTEGACKVTFSRVLAKMQKETMLAIISLLIINQL